jgi:voltage-gated potassium channel
VGDVEAAERVGERGAMISLRQWKHTALLAALIALSVLEPLSAHFSEQTQVVGGVVAALIYIGVLLVVFERHWERRVALTLITCAIAASVFHQVLPLRSQAGAIAYHCLAALFLAFGVAVILQRIFERVTIRTDDVIGALCGYLLAAAAWGNLYALVYIVYPASFRVADGVAAKLGNWHWQRFLFDYFSVATLTTIGFGDIAPAGSPVYSMVWVESVFGQFYIAVVVAQLVGLRLAEAIKRNSGE